MANQPHDKPSGHHAESPAHVTMVSMFGAGADEHDVQPPGADPNAVRAGHEADRFGARAILYVPALVTITLIASYVMVTFVFGYLVNTAPNPRSENDPQVVQRNGAPINDRFGTISTWDPKPIAPSEPDTKVAQPRLEYLKQQGDPASPAFERSKRPLQIGNSPEIRPEDLRAENYTDPATGQKVLATAAYLGADKNLARIPIDDAIHLVAGHKAKGVLPVRGEPVKLVRTSDEVSKQSNAGRPTFPVNTTPAAEKHDHKDHKDEKKEEKKDGK